MKTRDGCSPLVLYSRRLDGAPALIAKVNGWGWHMSKKIDANTWQLMLCAPENMVRSPKIAATQRYLTAPAPVRGTLQNWLETQEAGLDARRTGSRPASDKSSTGLKCYRQSVL